VRCRGSTLRVGHAHRVVGVGDNVLGESLLWWSDYIVCNSEHPNKICNRKHKKEHLGQYYVDKGYPTPVCTSSMGRTHPPKGNPKAREEAEVGDQEGLTLQRETLM
jgi:hypothetical protein